jgi:predicted PurR-regulated permease PerM
MRIAQWAGLIALCTLVFLLWQVRQLVLLLFAGIVLAVALDTLARIPQRYGFRRGPSLAIATLTVFLTIALLGLLVVPPLVDQFGTFINLIPEALQELEVLANDVIARLPTEMELPSLIELFSTLYPQTSRLLGQSLMFLNNSLNVLIGLFLVAILTVLLIADPPAYTEAFIRVFPAFYRPRVRYILQQCDRALRGWVVGVLINSAFIATLSGLGLWAIGVRLVLVHAAIAGVCNFIPNIGPTLSVLPPIVVALTDNPWKALGVLGLYFVLQNVESGVLTPLVMARQVSLLPGLILLAQVIFASFFGFLGLFLALPLAAVFQVWLREVVILDVLDRWQTGSFEHGPSSTIPALSSPLPALAEGKKPPDDDPAAPSKPDRDLPSPPNA